VTIAVIVVLAAAWSLYAVRWWRDRSGKPPFFARSDGQPRRARPWPMMACGIAWVAIGFFYLALVSTLGWWSAIGGFSFLIGGAVFLVEGWRSRARELDASPKP